MEFEENDGETQKNFSTFYFLAIFTTKIQTISLLENDFLRSYYLNKLYLVFIPFNQNGTKPDFILQAGNFKKLRYSLGLVATAASASMIGNGGYRYDFVKVLSDAKLEPYADGYFDPYYDGFLYLFSLMHLSGKYQIQTPEQRN